MGMPRELNRSSSGIYYYILENSEGGLGSKSCYLIARSFFSSSTLIFEKNLGDINGTGEDSCKGLRNDSPFALPECSILLLTSTGIGLILKGSGSGFSTGFSVFI